MELPVSPLEQSLILPIAGHEDASNIASLQVGSTCESGGRVNM